MLLQAARHNHYWTDLLDDLEGISWLRIISILMNTNHGFSNYEKCKKRDHTQVRLDVFDDEEVKKFTSKSAENAKKVDRVLDEMCHLLAIQTTPTRKLKWTGAFFMKCITNIYSNIYVNTHLLPMAEQKQGSVIGLFKEQFLKLSSKMPVVILPTHRSYMDFLFVTYFMFINELPLPIVAAGDNFKALGSMMTNYLKATGAFLLRRNANNKHDIEANDYFDILRAYVRSILAGGENPIEFFMEGTRTRLGQVLRPKTGLLSMIVDMCLKGLVDDVCILPVAINYQRPIEEQLYVNEMTPQISKSKPKETTKNLLAALDKIRKRRYGKVYVRFLEPFRLSDYREQWKRASSMTAIDESNLLHDLTNSLASKVCLAQANANVLMPFNLMTYSMLARSFLANKNIKSSNPATRETESEWLRVPIEDVTQDFLVLEDLLRATNSDFVAGWKGHLDILDEFKLDRDGIIAASPDRKTIQFEHDARTFHTFSYYGNQVMQILLPVAISSLLGNDDFAGDKISGTKLEQYKNIRALLAREFLVDDIYLEKEFVQGFECIKKGLVCKSAKDIVFRHLSYFVNSYLIFLTYLEQVDVMVKSEFFQKTTSENGNHFISKDMLNNMMNLVKDLEICRNIAEDDPKSRQSTSARREEQLEVQSKEKLSGLIGRFEDVQHRIDQVNAPKKGKLDKLNERFRKVLNHVHRSK